MPPSHRKVIQDIIQCRTEALGGNLYSCEQCAKLHYSFHSCQNRHCPKCQNNLANEWLDNQKQRLLPGEHFLVTFTIPEELRSIARAHQKIVYNILFQASSRALLDLAADPRFVGGKIGMVGVLHTWTRDLFYHPHVHYIATGGGRTPNGQWLNSRPNFLVHITPLSILFRAKFRDLLKKTELFQLVDPRVWQKNWGVHCKAVDSGLRAFKYLAPYLFRVAISNNRIHTPDDNGMVTFSYKDSADQQTKFSTIPAQEFIRRFLQHVLPDHFIKVRYYGLLSRTNRELFETAKILLHAKLDTLSKSGAASEQGTPDTALRCPTCGSVLILLQRLLPDRRGPP
jgi:hypothetical protein